MSNTGRNSPAVSIIVPVYNAERFIEKCVDSLIGQTFQDLEIFLVNDRSKDSSLKWLQRYAEQDSRVKVIDLPQNCGAAGARNHALARAVGEWIAFVDIDDWLDLDRYECLYAYAREHDVDAVMDGYVYNDDVGRVKAVEPITRELRFLSGHEMIDEMFFGSISAFAPWHGIYKRSIVKELSFQAIRGDDAMFNFDFYARAKKVCLVPSLSYHFRELDSSETRGYRPPESVGSLRGVEACAAYLKGNDALRQLVPDFDSIADYHLLGEYATIARNVCEKDCPENFTQRREFLRRISETPYFRSAFEDERARERISGRKRRFLSLLYHRWITMATVYMNLKGQWKKIEALFKS